MFVVDSMQTQAWKCFCYIANAKALVGLLFVCVFICINVCAKCIKQNQCESLLNKKKKFGNYMLSL